jgi:hypothetical protein
MSAIYSADGAEYIYVYIYIHIGSSEWKSILGDPDVDGMIKLKWVFMN